MSGSGYTSRNHVESDYLLSYRLCTTWQISIHWCQKCNQTINKQVNGNLIRQNFKRSQFSAREQYTSMIRKIFNLKAVQCNFPFVIITLDLTLSQKVTNSCGCYSGRAVLVWLPIAQMRMWSLAESERGCLVIRGLCWYFSMLQCMIYSHNVNHLQKKVRLGSGVIVAINKNQPLSFTALSLTLETPCVTVKQTSPCRKPQHINDNY